MKAFLINSIIAGVVFGLMDSMWFAVFMKKFATNELTPILRLSDGKMMPHMPSVFAAYALMVVSSSVFLVPRLSTDSSLILNFAIGGLLGLCVFGIFDFTNSALFSPYPMRFVVADVAWGTLMYGCLAVILVKFSPSLTQ